MAAAVALNLSGEFIQASMRCLSGLGLKEVPKFSVYSNNEMIIF